MTDWSSKMNQTFEFYVVDPGTWMDEKKLDNVTSCSITRDSTSETLGSATLEVTDAVNGDGTKDYDWLATECYVRVYLVAIQNGLREKIPLGTYLVQTPSSKFDGKKRDISITAYSPLLELKENPTSLGYSLLKGENIMEQAYLICRDHMRAPVVRAKCETDLNVDFVSNTDDTWLSFVTDLIANAKYLFELDEMGRVLFAPKQDTASLQPVWTFDDSNSSILYPEITDEHDLYGIPNVVEVVYSKNGDYFYSRVVNDDENSPTSTVNRGREIMKRVTDPDTLGNPTQEMIDEYAERVLSESSTLERTVTYAHGYCPVRVGDCVRLNYKRASLTDIKARVVSQTIECKSGCKVSEKAVFKDKLWR